jgi:hypothetical protein
VVLPASVSPASLLFVALILVMVSCCIHKSSHQVIYLKYSLIIVNRYIFIKL